MDLMEAHSRESEQYSKSSEVRMSKVERKLEIQGQEPEVGTRRPL